MKEIDKVDHPDIIPLNERKPELEKLVAFHMTEIEVPRFISTKRYTSNVMPEKFSSKFERQEFEAEEIKRLINGYDGLSGKGYGWLNYAKIRALKGGKIVPQFRSAQEGYFRKMDELKNAAITGGDVRGIVGYKRRRVGFSWMASWNIWHNCATTPFWQVGMNSKGDVDSRRLFAFVKFMHQNVPAFLRPRASVADRRDYMEFAYWYDVIKKKVTASKGMNCEKRGLQSWILSLPPTDNAHEGQAYNELLIDEAGKQDNLLKNWSFAEDTLLDNTRRVGIPVILGTVGDIDKDGKGLMEMYLNSDSYSLDKFAYHGYNGLIMDEFGNDMIEDAVRWIIYERDRRKNSSREVREAFVQKYPLNQRDAFNYVTSGGVGNIELINDQLIKLDINPPEKRVGWMRRKPDGGVDFVPNPDGKVIVYEIPDPNRANGYVAGLDGVDHDDKRKSRDNSDLGLAIIAKPFGVAPPRLCVEYVDRPMKVDSFFEQSAMILEWYNFTKVLIEDNRYRAVNYFKLHHPKLLPLVPKSLATAFKGAVEMKNSVTMTEERRQQMMGLIESNVDSYSEHNPSKRLYQQFKVFGDEHADDDLAIAYGWGLVLLQADRRPARSADELQKTVSTRLEWKNGRLTPMHNEKPILMQGRRVHPILNRR